MRRADAVGRSMRTSVGPRASTSRWPPKLSLSSSSRGEPSALHRKCASTLNTVASRTRVPSSRQEAQFRGVCACELTRSAGRMRVRGLVVRKRRLKEDVIDCTSAIFSFRGWSPIVCIALSERRTVMSSNGVRRTSRFLSTASPRRIGTRRRSACSALSPSFACTGTQLSNRSCGKHLAARGRTASRANLAPRPRHDDVSRISICSGAQQRIRLATQPNCARSRPTCPYKAYWPVTNMTASRSSETAMTIVMTPSPRFFSPGGSLGIMTASRSGFRRAGLSAEVLSRDDDSRDSHRMKLVGAENTG